MEKIKEEAFEILDISEKIYQIQDLKLQLVIKATFQKVAFFVI